MQMSEFERNGACTSLGIEELRGELLSVAHQQVRSSLRELRHNKLVTLEQQRGLVEDIQCRENEIAALKEQVIGLSGQLAQRTVLYSAQERRWREEGRGREVLESDLKNEVIALRSRMQQLEKQYGEIDRERIEALMTVRQQQEELARLETELAAERDRVLDLDEELGTAASQNLALQTVVERLRGADLEDLVS
jgi:chromosome segregation ATPase